MSYLVICTFEIIDANQEDFKHAYAELAKLGLMRVRNINGLAVMPAASVIGEFDGRTPRLVMRHVERGIKAVFFNRRVRVEFFIYVVGGWARGALTTI